MTYPYEPNEAKIDMRSEQSSIASINTPTPSASSRNRTPTKLRKTIDGTFTAAAETWRSPKLKRLTIQVGGSLCLACTSASWRERRAESNLQARSRRTFTGCDQCVQGMGCGVGAVLICIACSLSLHLVTSTFSILYFVTHADRYSSLILDIAREY